MLPVLPWVLHNAAGTGQCIVRVFLSTQLWDDIMCADVCRFGSAADSDHVLYLVVVCVHARPRLLVIARGINASCMFKFPNRTGFDFDDDGFVCLPRLQLKSARVEF